VKKRNKDRRLQHAGPKFRNVAQTKKRVKVNPSEKFTKEEKENLSYLGSMLSRPNDEQEELIERMLESEERGQLQPAKRQKHNHEQHR
jgi:hypothetical protein